MQLNFDTLSEWYDQPLDTITDINASNKNINEVQDISSCSKLRKLNLSNNDLSGEKVNFFGLESLTVLKLSNNKFKSFEGVEHLKQLSVLQMDHNEMDIMTNHISSLNNLKALILNHNEISVVENLNDLKQLNTLVLSHNKIKTLAGTLTGLDSLVKISVSHNSLKKVPDLSAYAKTLKSLRFNDNSIPKVPFSIRECQAIEILDLGNNKVSEWSDIAPLGSLLNLHELNLKGNPITSKEDYKEKILKLIPSLRILDGERFDSKFLERKQKQTQNLKLMEKKDRLKREKEEKTNQSETSDKIRKPRHKKLLREEVEKAQNKNSTKKQIPEKVNANVNTTTTKKKNLLRQNEMDIDGGDENNKNKKRKRSQKQNDDKDNQIKKDKIKEPKSGKKKNDKFFDNDSTDVNELLDKDHHMNVDSSSVEKIETTSEENKTKSKLSKQNPIQQLKKPERTGVLSIVDKSKHIKKKSKTEDIVQTLENLKQKEDSVSTGLGADGWD